MISRRELLAGTMSLAAGLPFASAPLGGQRSSLQVFEARIKALELDAACRLGVAVLDSRSGAFVGHRADERFPMCSTFKLLLAGAVLAKVDRDEERLDRVVRYSKADLVANSPTAQAHAANGRLTVKELCEAAVTLSDNTAANLLIASLGGTAGVTAFARSMGDDKTRLDRIEPAMSECVPGDMRDTSTPRAMLRILQRLALGDTLSQASRKQIVDWLLRCKTGDHRLRAGLPPDWKIGDKTGSGDHGTTNDLAIAWPSKQAPILVSVYLTGSRQDSAKRDAVVASVGELISTLVHGSK